MVVADGTYEHGGSSADPPTAWLYDERNMKRQNTSQSHPKQSFLMDRFWKADIRQRADVT